jgi:hypothetical protein
LLPANLSLDSIVGIGEAVASREKAMQNMLTGMSIIALAAGATWLAHQLSPAAPGDQPQESIARLIQDLDSEKFEVRKQAEEELEQLGKPALEPLKRLLAEKPPLEVVMRATRLLERLAIHEDGGPVVNGLKVRLTADRETVVPGEQFHFTTWLCNMTAEDLNVNIGDSLHGNRVTEGTVFRRLEGDASGTKHEPQLYSKRGFGLCGTGAYPLVVTVPAKSALTFRTEAAFGKQPDAPLGYNLTRWKDLTLAAPATGTHRLEVALQADANSYRHWVNEIPSPDRPANERAGRWIGSIRSNELLIQVGQ